MWSHWHHSLAHPTDLQPELLRGLPRPCPPPGLGTAASGSVLRATIIRARILHCLRPAPRCTPSHLWSHTVPRTTTAAFVLQTRNWGPSGFLPRPRPPCRDAAEPGKPGPCRVQLLHWQTGLASPQTIHPAATVLGSQKISAVVPWSLREGGWPWASWRWQGWARAHMEPARLQGARETEAPAVLTPSWAAGHSLWLPISVPLPMFCLYVSVPTLSWHLLCLSLHVHQPICLSWPPIHPQRRAP